MIFARAIVLFLRALAARQVANRQLYLSFDRVGLLAIDPACIGRPWLLLAKPSFAAWCAPACRTPTWAARSHLAATRYVLCGGARLVLRSCGVLLAPIDSIPSGDGRRIS